MSRVEDVLAAHYTYTAGRGMTVRCKCGEVVGERGGRANIGNSATHRAHVAAALAAAGIGDVAEAERRGAQAVLDAVERVCPSLALDENHRVADKMLTAAREAARNAGAR